MTEPGTTEPGTTERGDGPPDAGWIAIPTPAANEFQTLVLRPWGKLDRDEPVLGFRVMPHHCNSRQICHGGMLMTFCDFLLPTLARLIDPEDDRYTPTVSVTTNFLAPAPLGAWLEGRGRVLRRTTNLLFVEGTVRIGDRPTVQASGIFKRGSHDGRRAGARDMLDRMRAAG